MIPALPMATLAVAAWIMWTFIRVATYYYMRLDIEFSLAIYTILELRSLIVSEVAITLQEIPIYVPIFFLSLFGCLILSLGSVLIAATEFEAQQAERESESNPGSTSKRYRPFAVIASSGVMAIAGLLALPENRAFNRSPESAADSKTNVIEGPNPFPDAESVTPIFYEQKNSFRSRFGFRLPEGTNVVFIILESARESFVDLENSEFFRASPETLRVENFFVPVPHSSNSHYSLYTGLHSERDFEEKYEKMRPAETLPRLLEKHGYKNYYVYTDHTAFESENVMLEKLGMQVTEKRQLQKRKNPETSDYYASFSFGMDDIALLHATNELLDNANPGRQAFSFSLVMTNSHYPYLNPHPERFNRHNNNTILGRHRNGVDYGMHIADRVVEEFRKRGLEQKTLFVLMSDHGESFGERGFYRHSFSLYNEEVRVPLVFRHPKFARLTSPADRALPQGSMLDVFPTVFDMLDLEIPRSLQGRSLFDPEYSFRLPLWVWRLDDYRGFIFDDSKFLYNSV
ncbi:MAG: sulfatase-like hydrolase/transferase, partial [Leptospirales bacterium]